MKVLVTGGAGFIGAHVVRMLAERGDEVRVLLAPGESPAALAGLEVEAVEGDVRDLPGLREAVSDCGAVIHLAAIYALWMRDYRPMYQVNVDGTRNIMTAALDAGVDKIVYTSSIAALGVEQGMTPSNEETRFNQHKKATHYVLSKHYAQRVVREFAAQGLPVVSVHPSFPFGRGDRRPTPTGRSVIRILEGSYFAAGPGGINIVDVEDVARGHLLALDSGEDGTNYILGGTDITTHDFFGVVQDIAGAKKGHFRVPPTAMVAIGWFGDAVGAFTEPLLDTRTSRYTMQYLYYDSSRATRELGYTITPLNEAVGKAIRWFREHGYFEKDASWRHAPWKRKRP